MSDLATQRALQCGTCAGQCLFSPGAQALICQSCETHHPIHIDPDADPAQEFHYDPNLPHTEQTQISQTRTHQCETCGGEVLFVGPVLSERCAYCDGPVVMNASEASYETLGIIPFHLEPDTAKTRAQAWVDGLVAAPVDLASVVAEGRVAGLYAPFWTFDSKEAVEYMVRYRVGSGDDTETRTYRGTMNTEFDDLLMPASPHVTPLIRDGILHEFDPDRLRPYAPSYLSGFAAEAHHQTVPEGLAANAPDKKLLLRNRVKKHSGKSRITSVTFKTHTTGIRYRRILLPVWILHYSHRNRPYKVVVCGLHGRTFGERPFSALKLYGYAAALTALTIGFGWVWGAAGIL